MRPTAIRALFLITAALMTLSTVTAQADTYTYDAAGNIIKIDKVGSQPQVNPAPITWYHEGDGSVYTQTTNGTAITGGGPIWSEPNPAWSIVGSGDFNGDGIKDLLWNNKTSGQVYLMLMKNATEQKNGAMLYQEPNIQWKIVATGDLNGDGTTDLIWWNNSTGQVYAQTIVNGKITNGSIIYTEPDTRWKIVGTGDVNGNGKSDLIWWNSNTGQVAVGTTNSLNQASAQVIYSEPDTNWRIAGVGDINGNGKADLIWHNKTTGQVYGMLLNGTAITAGAIIHTEPDTNWEIVSVGDYNNDGKADILWQNISTGQVYLMELNGLSVSKGTMLYTEPNTTWHIQGETEWRNRVYGTGVTTTR
ncbi:MAG: VCBS repeat-containing protein [Desulfuromonadales bacterium]